MWCFKRKDYHQIWRWMHHSFITHLHLYVSVLWSLVTLTFNILHSTMERWLHMSVMRNLYTKFEIPTSFHSRITSLEGMDRSPAIRCDINKQFEHTEKTCSTVKDTLIPHSSGPLYTAIWWLVHRLLTGALLHLVQQGEALMGCSPT